MRINEYYCAIGAWPVVIAGRYGWEGLGGLGMDCQWLAGLLLWGYL